MLKAARLRADRNTWALAGLAAVIVLWAMLDLSLERLDLSLYAREASIGIETAVALSSLLGALVLSLFPTDSDAARLRWVAAGFVVMGAGALLFGVLGELLLGRMAPGGPAYAWLLTRTFAGGMFVAGLAFATPLRFGHWPLLVSLAAIGLLGVLVYAGESTPAAMLGAPRFAGEGSGGAEGEIGLWYWLPSALPLGLAVAAVAGSVRNRAAGGAAAWLPFAMVLLAGSQLHSLFWPSAFGPVLTPVDLLRLAFAILVAVGAILELRRFAAERASLLATERQRTQRLGELAALKADFTAMVAHELDSPLAAIGGFTDMLSIEDLGSEHKRSALSGIRAETGLLRSLVEDVRAAATVERDDFALRTQPVGVEELLADAAAFASNLPDEHRVTVSAIPESVWADQERIGQVLRNLLTNAAKFSEEENTIAVRAVRNGGRVRIEVADQGVGIHPDDMVRIFEKFGRGRDRLGKAVPGVGLGLYLSNRIVRAHGSSLQADSTPEKARRSHSSWRSRDEPHPMIRLLLVEDHAAFREPLAFMFEREADFTVAAQAGSVAEAREVLEGLDLALVDIDLPDGSGLDLIEELRAASPGVTVMVLSGSTDRMQHARAVEAGAAALLHKSTRISGIIDAARRVSAGETLLSAGEVVELLNYASRQRSQDRDTGLAIQRLTPREREILQALAEGLSNKEVAERMYISLKTQRTHMANILAKLGVSSQMQALLFALRHGIVDLPR